MVQTLQSTLGQAGRGRRKVDVIFVVLTAQRPEERARFSWRRLFERKQAQIEYVKRDRIRFAVITWSGSLSDMDWEEIAEMAGRAGRMLVLPRQITPPEELGLSRLPVWEYADQVARQFVLQTIQQSPLPLYRKSIGVVDLRGSAVPFVRQAIRYASVVRVVTRNQAMYDGVAEEMMETYGASVLVSQNQDDAYRCAIVYAPHGLTDRHSAEISPPIVTVDRVEVAGHARVINGFHQQIPEDILALKPPMIADGDFLAALWQMCGQRELSTLPIDRCRVGDNDVSLGDVSMYLAKMEEKERQGDTALRRAEESTVRA
ncbi:hypothetical protein [Zongyangia hominis]|uniref:Uncharacterized protein n=1 Tax=Zongyangia hominis TaxID=2763677 RepID=A0A926IC58_9FIRM|nr:hypothetical protein [Zongyangia hominis]MBC8571008.1 hypothetical protein [Zongyangia hominis]